MGRKSVAVMLQWGRGYMTAERSGRYGYQVREAWLQWGRGYMTAESVFAVEGIQRRMLRPCA